MTSEPAVRLEHHSLYPESGGNTDLDASAVKPWELPEDDDLAEETPVVRAYVGYLRRRPDSVVASSRAIARARGAVLVHCAAGKDRTGVVVAVALDAAEIDRDAIVDDYMATGERIGAIVARLVRSPTYRSQLERYDPQQHAPVPGTMERFLQLVDERFGGAAAWLSANGLGGPDLERLRSRLASSARAGRGQSSRPPPGAGCS